MRRGRLSVERRCRTIVLVVLRQVGLGIFELWNFELIDAGENHHWLCEFDELALRNFVNFLQFYDVSHKVWRVGLARE